MQSLMKDTRLDLEAPLLSVRRHSVPPAVKPGSELEDPVNAKSLTPSWRSTAPFYNSELKSGPVKKPGVVPFVWEQKPGQPKAGSAFRQRPPPVPAFPPGRTLNDTVPNGPCRDPNNTFQDSANSIREKKATEMPGAEALDELLQEEEDTFSDAVETLSRTESFSMNCSVSGLSGIPVASVPSGSFFTDQQARALMMDRFLPAAQAMATSSSQCPSRKPAKLANRVENGEYGLRREPLPYQHRPNFLARYPHDHMDTFGGNDDDDYEDNGGGKEHFTSKACGLLPRLFLKSSLCLLTPMSGVKVGRRRPLPRPTRQMISSVLHNDVPLSPAEDELWELIHKNKLSSGIPQGEGESKSTSMSNQHLQWSDSHALDGSSSCRGSREDLVEIVKSDMRNGRNNGSESLDKDGERYWEISSSHGSLQGSSVFSPTVVEDIHVDSVVLQAIPHSKHSSTESEMDFESLTETHKSTNIISEVDNQRMEQSSVLEGYNGVVLQPETSGIIKSNMEFYFGRNANEHASSNDCSLFLKGGGQLKNNSSSSHSILSPPLPKTPSESWLSRILPSVSVKIPSGQPMLDIHSTHRKQAFISSFTDSSQENDVKSLESQHPQIPLAVPMQKIPPGLCELQQCQITLTKAEERSVKHFEPRGNRIPDIKLLKPQRRQIRFADVLMTPLSPGSEM